MNELQGSEGVKSIYFTRNLIQSAIDRGDSTLDLEKKEINTAPCIRVLRVLTNTCVLKINLRSNFISTEIALRSFSVLESTRITKLDLTGNKINSPEKIRILLESLKKTHVRKLSLGLNQVNTVENIEALRHLKNTSITSLDLSGNEINTPKKISALDALKDTPVTQLKLGSNGINSESLIRFLGIVSRIISIIKLDLIHNGINTAEQINALEIFQDTTVKIIRLTGNKSVFYKQSAKAAMIALMDKGIQIQVAGLELGYTPVRLKEERDLGEGKGNLEEEKTEPVDIYLESPPSESNLVKNLKVFLDQSKYKQAILSICQFPELAAALSQINPSDLKVIFQCVEQKIKDSNISDLKEKYQKELIKEAIQTNLSLYRYTEKGLQTAKVTLTPEGMISHPVLVYPCFPLKALRTVLEEAQKLNISDILRDAHSEIPEQSYLVRTLRYFLPTESNNMQNRLINSGTSHAPRIAWLLIKKISWWQASKIFIGQAKGLIGLENSQSWQAALEGELKNLLDSFLSLKAFFDGYQDQEKKLRFYDLFLTLAKDEGLKNLIQEHRAELSELFAAAEIPGFDTETAGKALDILTLLQDEIQSIEHYQDLQLTEMICQILPRWAKESKKLSQLTTQAITIFENLSRVVEAFTDAGLLPQANIQVDVLFHKAAEIAGVHKREGNNISKTKYAYLCNIDERNRVDLAKLFGEFNETLGLLDSPIATLIHAKNLTKMQFVGKENYLYAIEHCVLNKFCFCLAKFNCCSFSHSQFIDCDFTEALFDKAVHFKNTLVDAATAKTLFPLLKQSLRGGVSITGKLVLYGNFSEINLEGINLALLDTNFATGILPQSFAKDKGKSRLKKKDSVEDNHSQEEAEESTSFVGGLCAYLAGYLPSVVEGVYNGFESMVETIEGYLPDAEEIIESEEDENGQLIELKELFNAELDAIKSRMKELEHKVGEEVSKELSLLKDKQTKLGNALEPLHNYWIEKEKARDERKKISEIPILHAYYKALLTDLSGVLHSLLVVRSHLLKVEEGAATNYAAKSSMPTFVLGTTSRATGVAKTVVDFAPSAIKCLESFLSTSNRLLNFLQPLTQAIPYVNIATGAADVATKFVVNTTDNWKFLNSHEAMLELTPKGLDKIAEQLSRRLAATYHEQVLLLTEKGARRFAECGAIRILVLLLNGHIKGQQDPIKEIVDAIGHYDISIDELEIPWLKKKIALPFWKETLETIDKKDRSLRQDMLYRMAGRCLKQGKVRYYYSNDEKILVNSKREKYKRPFTDQPMTKAKYAGYITIEDVRDLPQYMTLDLDRLGPRSFIEKPKKDMKGKGKQEESLNSSEKKVTQLSHVSQDETSTSIGIANPLMHQENKELVKLRNRVKVQDEQINQLRELVNAILTSSSQGHHYDFSGYLLRLRSNTTVKDYLKEQKKNEKD